MRAEFLGCKLELIVESNDLEGTLGYSPAYLRGTGTAQVRIITEDGSGTAEIDVSTRRLRPVPLGGKARDLPVDGGWRRSVHVIDDNLPAQQSGTIPRHQQVRLHVRARVDEDVIHHHGGGRLQDVPVNAGGGEGHMLQGWEPSIREPY